MVLVELGHEVTCAATSREALDTVDAQAFDAAILDYELGDETSEPIATRLAQRRIPFIVSSGRHSSELPPGLSAGQHLRKPYFMTQLEEALRSCGVSEGPEM